jgi:hypothetical protein
MLEWLRASSCALATSSHVVFRYPHLPRQPSTERGLPKRATIPTPLDASEDLLRIAASRLQVPTSCSDSIVAAPAASASAWTPVKRGFKRRAIAAMRSVALPSRTTEESNYWSGGNTEANGSAVEGEATTNGSHGITASARLTASVARSAC